jgi:hypothetical protein
MMLGMREKSNVRRENGSARRSSRRSPTEKGNQLSKTMMSARFARFA